MDVFGDADVPSITSVRVAILRHGRWSSPHTSRAGYNGTARAYGARTPRVTIVPGSSGRAGAGMWLTTVRAG